MLMLHAGFSVLKATSRATHQTTCLRKMRMGFLTNWIKRLVQLMLHLVPSRHWKQMLQSEIQCPAVGSEGLSGFPPHAQYLEGISCPEAPWFGALSEPWRLPPIP